MTQVVECLPSKCDPLSSTSSTAKKKDGLNQYVHYDSIIIKTKVHICICQRMHVQIIILILFLRG
jgi:hypothetical protein